MTIRVTLINPARKRFWQAKWIDPVTGRSHIKSTETTVKRDAERFAARLEDELNAGEYKPTARLTVEELRERYLAEVSDTKAHTTKLKTISMFNGDTVPIRQCCRQLSVSRNSSGVIPKSGEREFRLVEPG